MYKGDGVAANTTNTVDAIEPISQDQPESSRDAKASSDEAKERNGLSPISEDQEPSVPSGHDSTVDADPDPDPMGFGRHRCHNVTREQMAVDHPKGNTRKMKKFYTQQNHLIDQFLGADDEERLQVEDEVRNGPKIRFAVNASFIVNFCLFVIQLYAAISTGSLSASHSSVLAEFKQARIELTIHSCSRPLPMPS